VDSSTEWASKRGIFAFITDAEAKDWQSSVDIALRRFAAYHDLEGGLQASPSPSREGNPDGTPSLIAALVRVNSSVGEIRC
jgi:hypothetical protein